MDELTDVEILLLNEEEYNEYLETIKQTLIRDYVVNSNNTITDSAGRQMELSKWVTRRSRTEITNDIINNTIQLSEDFDNPYLIIDYYSDSSNLCDPFQNKIYTSKEGVSSKYPHISTALYRSGGGVGHHNCRHRIDPYIFGITKKQEEIPKKELKQNRKNREDWLKANNNVQKYNRRYQIEPTKQNKQKLDEWKKRRNDIPQPSDTLFATNIPQSLIVP